MLEDEDIIFGYKCLGKLKKKDNHYTLRELSAFLGFSSKKSLYKIKPFIKFSSLGIFSFNGIDMDTSEKRYYFNPDALTDLLLNAIANEVGERVIMTWKRR